LPSETHRRREGWTDGVNRAHDAEIHEFDITSDGIVVGSRSCGARALDECQHLVDPFVDVHVVGRAVHDFHPLVVERPAEASRDPSQLDRVLLQGGDHPGLAGRGSVEDEVHALQRSVSRARSGDRGSARQA
jgi:hypothetical protein